MFLKRKRLEYEIDSLNRSIRLMRLQNKQLQELLKDKFYEPEVIAEDSDDYVGKTTVAVLTAIHNYCNKHQQPHCRCRFFDSDKGCILNSRPVYWEMDQVAEILKPEKPEK